MLTIYLGFSTLLLGLFDIIGPTRNVRSVVLKVLLIGTSVIGLVCFLEAMGYIMKVGV